MENKNAVETDLPDEPILRRAYMFLEERDWDNAYAYADKALDANPENCMAYICRLLCELGISNEKYLEYADVDFGGSREYKNALKFADGKQLEFLKHALSRARENEAKRLEKQEKADEIKRERWLLESKIKDEENLIFSCNRKEDEIAENRKFRILGGLYILFFLLFVGGLALAGYNIIMFVACFLSGVVGTWTLHAVMCYTDDTVDSKFFAFGLGPINLASMCIWGLVKSIKKLALKNPAKKAELNKTIRESRERKEKLKKQLEEFDAAHPYLP